MKLQEELDPESIETARKDTDALQQQYTADRKWWKREDTAHFSAGICRSVTF